MLGLAVLFFVGLYFLILIFGTCFAYRFFKNRSRKLAIYSGTTVFLAIFLPVFWDWIPTIIAHDYYCKQAGFTEFKPVEQWKKENPGVWEGLQPYPSRVYDKDWSREYVDFNGKPFYKTPLNERISRYSRGENIKFLMIQKGEVFLYDEKTKEVLSKSITIRTGPGNSLELGSRYGWSGYKLWLNMSDCGGSSKDISATRSFINQQLKKSGVKYDY